MPTIARCRLRRRKKKREAAELVVLLGNDLISDGGCVFAEDSYLQDLGQQIHDGTVGGTDQNAVQPRPHEQPLIEWFGRSKATGPDGAPAVLYRGEHGALAEGEHFQSRLNSISFTADRTAAITYALSPNDSQLDRFVEAPRVALVHLKIENPIIENHNDPFIELSHLAAELGRREAKRIALKFSGDIEYTGNWAENYACEYGSVAELLKEKPLELMNLYFNAYKFLDDLVEVDRLKAAGYDGAIHIGNGETASVLEYRVFDLRQVRPALSTRSIPPVSGMAATALVT